MKVSKSWLAAEGVRISFREKSPRADPCQSSTANPLQDTAEPVSLEWGHL